MQICFSSSGADTVILYDSDFNPQNDLQVQHIVILHEIESQFYSRVTLCSIWDLGYI